MCIRAATYNNVYVNKKNAGFELPRSKLWLSPITMHVFTTVLKLYIQLTWRLEAQAGQTLTNQEGDW